MNQPQNSMQGMAMMFPELFYCKHTCVLPAY